MPVKKSTKHTAPLHPLQDPTNFAIARHKLGLSTEDLGKALYLGAGESFTIRRWETGQAIPPGPVAVALELFLRLPEHQRPLPKPKTTKRGRPPLPPPDDAAARAVVERIITAELPCSTTKLIS